MSLFDVEVDPDDPTVANGVALMYSGGSDSTLAACRLAQTFPKIHLITYLRYGFLSADAPSEHFERMKRRFPHVEFVHHRIQYGKLYEHVEKHEKFKNLLKHGSMTSVPCGHCKVAMHWRTVLWCHDNDVSWAADGAIKGNEQFAEQNPEILMQPLQDFYRRFGIRLLHPVWHKGLATEEELFELGITDTPHIKRTKKDRQVVCSQHILFASYVRKYLHNHTFEEYEEASREYLGRKLEHVEELTAEHLEGEGSAKVRSLLK